MSGIVNTDLQNGYKVIGFPFRSFHSFGDPQCLRSLLRYPSTRFTTSFSSFLLTETPVPLVTVYVNEIPVGPTVLKWPQQRHPSDLSPDIDPFSSVSYLSVISKDLFSNCTQPDSTTRHLYYFSPILNLHLEGSGRLLKLYPHSFCTSYY